MSSDELHFDGARYISAASAAHSSGLHRDYIARLARSGKVRGKRIGKSWYVEEKSLQNFQIKQEYKDAKRKTELAHERKREYQKSFRSLDAFFGDVVHTKQTFTAKPTAAKSEEKFDAKKQLVAAIAKKVPTPSLNVAPLYAVSPTLDFLHRATALITAITLVFGAYAFADPATARPIIAEARSSIAYGGMALLNAPGTLAQVIRTGIENPRNIFTNADAVIASSTVASPTTAFDSLAAANAAGADSFFSTLARTVNTSINDIIFRASFTNALAALQGERGSVFVTIAPAAKNPIVQKQRTVTTRTAPTPTTIINQPIRERVTETQRVIPIGGITEEYLNQRLASLNTDLTNRMLTLTTSNSTTINNVYQTLGMVGRVEELKDTKLHTPTIDGGTITGATISGGSITATDFSGVLPIAKGGTATSAAPTYGKVLLGNAAGAYDLVATSSLGISSGGTPGGSNTQVQFNDDGSFGGDADFSFNKTTNLLAVAFGSTTAASALDGIFVGRTATTTIRGDGIASTIPFASSTALTVSGTGYFGTASTTNLTVSGASGGLLKTSPNGVVSLATAGTDYAATSSVFGKAWEMINTTTLAPTTTVGILVSASSTFNGGLTISNSTTTNATTTNLAVTSTASTSNLIVGGTFTLRNLTGLLKATAGVVATALVDLAADVTGIVPVANGGTGWAALQAGAIPYGNGSSALSTTTAGTSGYVLGLNGTTPTWVASTTFSSGLAYSGGNVTNTGVLSITQNGGGSAQTGAITLATSTQSFNGLTVGNSITNSSGTFTITPSFSGTLNVSGGGTGLSSYTAGDILYASSPTALTTVASSTNGFVLTLQNGKPAWIATSTLSTITGTLAITSGGTGTTTVPVGQLLYGGASAYQSTATTSATIGNSLSYSGTFGSLVGGAAGTLSLNMGNANTWTALQQFANSSTTIASILDTLYVGRTATTTIRGDGVASSLPFASTTMITATTASSTNLWISSLASGSLLKTTTGGQVAAATAGSDFLASYDAFTHPAAGQSATTSLVLLSGAASSTQFSAARGFFNSIDATSTSATSTLSGMLAVGSNALNIISTGLIGIGTASPGKTLDVSGTGRFSSTFSLSNITGCIGGSALQTNGSGDIACGAISIGGASTGGGWTTNNVGQITLSTTTDQVALGASTTPYAKLSILSGSAATTTLALVPASAQTANILDIYNTSGALSSVFTAAGRLGIGTTSPWRALSVMGSSDLGDNALAGYFTATTSIASSLPFASTTMITATTASSTNVWISSLASGVLLKTTTGGQVTNAVAGTDYAAASATFGKSWEVSGNFLAPTTTTYITNIQQASSTLFSASQIKVGGTASTTIDTSGNVAIAGTLDATGKTTLGSASTTNISATYASSTSGFFGNLSIGALSGFLKATTGSVATSLISLTSDITGILGAPNGGTGWGNIAANTVVLGNGTAAIATTSAGTNGQVLALVSGVPSWVATTTLSTISGTLAVGSGGTGQTTFTSSQLLYGNGTNALSSVATTSVTAGTALSFSGTAGALVGGSALTINFAAPTTQALSIPFASTSIVSAYDILYVGRTATTTIRGDGVASSLPFASTTMITATTASSTNLWISGIASGSLLKTTTGGQVAAATAGTDYITSSLKDWNVSGIFLQPTTTNYVVNLYQGTSTLFSANQAWFGGTATSTFTAAGFLGIASSSPWAQLSVNTSAGSPAFAVGSSTTQFIVDKSGSVGIGTSTPWAKLSIFAASSTFTNTTLFAISSSTPAFATSTLFAISNTGSTTIAGLLNVSGSATSSIASGLQTPALDITSTSATSTFANGIQLTGGTLKINSLNGPLDIRDGVVGATTSVSAIYGGTGLTSYTAGDILYASSPTALTTVASSTNGFVLTLQNGKPTWIATSTLSTITGTLAIANGGTGTTTVPVGQLLYGGASAYQSTATTSATIGNSLSYSGTFGSLVGGAAGTLSLNMGNANTWTALQQFANSSTTIASILDTLYVGRTATTTIRGDGVASSLPFASSTALSVSGTGYFGTASTTNLTISGVTNGLLKTSTNGVVSVATAGSDYLALYDAWTHPAAGQSATTSVMLFNNGATTTNFGVYNILSIGQTSSTTIRGDGVASSLPFASTTMITATTASSTNLWISGIASGAILKTTTGGQVTAATAGSDFLNSSVKDWQVSGIFLQPTTTNYTTNIQNATSTLFSANQAWFGGTATSTFTAAGFLGIGSSTPWAQLSINPNALGSGVPAFAIGSSTRTTFLVDGAGRVGLGTTSPFALLTLFAASTSAPINVNLFAIASTTNNTSTTTLFSISNTGVITGLAFSLGGGTTTSETTTNLLVTGSTTLQNFTAGNATTTNATTTSLSAGSASTTNLFISSIVSGAILKTTTGGQVTSADAGTDYVSASGGSSNRVAYWTSASNISSDADLTFDGTTLTARDLIVSHTTPFLTIDDSDAAGTDFRIDVADGAATIKVDKDANLASSYLAFSVDGSEGARVDAGGNFGIGTTSPWRTLSVKGSSDLGNNALAGYFTATTSIASSLPFASTTMITATTASSTNLWISSLASGSLLKTTTGGQVTAATAGTDFLNSSVKDWQVSGIFLQPTTTNYTTNIQQASSTMFSARTAYFGGTATSTFDATGKLGVALASPTYHVDVAGFINTDQFSGYKQAGNTILYASTTNNSLAVGASGAATWMSALSTNWGSVAVGLSALGTTPTNANAAGNTGIGYYSLGSDTTGGANTATGYQSLSNNTTGASNVAFGYNALAFNTTGGSNTSVGRDSLGANTTGATNVALGTFALQTSTTSSNHVAIGYGALQSMRTSASNDAEGNTAVGYLAGNALTYGGANILLGYAAGDALTTGSNNIVLGYDIDAPSATASNQLNIGNILFGSNVNSTGTTVDTDALIGIGTSTPYSKLTIWGSDTSSGTNSLLVSDSASTTLFRVSNAGHCLTGETRILARRRRRRAKNHQRDASMVGDENVRLTKSNMDEYYFDAPEYVQIKDLAEGDLVLSFNECSGKMEWKPVIALYDMGEQPVYKLTTESGKQIRSTGTHPFLTEWGWVQAGNLRVGNTIAAPKSEVLKNHLSRDHHSSIIKTWSSVTTTSLFSMSSFGNSFRNASNRSRWNSNIVGRILSTIRPGVFARGNFAVSKKSVSKLSITNFSFFDRAKITSSSVPFGNQMTSWPRATAERVSGRDMFSSAKNFTDRGQADNSDVLFSGGCELQSGFDMFARDGRPSIENGLVSLAVGERVQNLPHHDARSVEREFASADLRVGDDVFIDDSALHMADSISQAQMKSKRSAFSKFQVLSSKLGALFAPREDISFERIVSIEYDGIEQVYDIAVSGTHNFVAEGLVAHNTYISGNAGIGVASPTYKLDVTGLGHFTGLVDAANFVATSSSATSTFAGGFSAGNNAALVVNQAASANSLYINPSGNVGIGTAAPLVNLDVYSVGGLGEINVHGPLGGMVKVSQADAVASGYLGMGYDSPKLGFNRSGSYFLYYNTSSGDITLNNTFGGGSKMYFDYQDSHKMALDSSGNLGIGVTSPSYKLDVAGFINTDQYSGYKQAGNTILYASTTNNTLAVGASAAAAWMSASSTLWYSVAVGPGALATTPVNASAQYNTAVGYNALNANTTGTQNTAVGYTALAANTSGTQNTAFGRATLTGNTTGANNTALGNAVLFANTTGVSNTGIGWATLFSNTTGGSNVAIGQSALFTATSSSNNTIIGHNAGTNISGATGAVGGSNTLLGYQAGYDITLGSHNLILGDFTTTGSGITTGSNNILLGQDLRTGFTNTSSNQLNIGNLIFGTGLGSGTTLSTGSVGIASSTPWAQLSINSVAGTPAFAIGSSTVTQFIVDKSGNVGVGTSSPAGTLAVQGTGFFSGNVTLAGLCMTGDTRLLARRRKNRRRADPENGCADGAGGTDEYYYDAPEHIAIKDIKSGDLVLSFNESTGKMEWQPVLGLYDMGEKPVYRLTTESGKTIRTTGTHPFLTEWGWVQAGNLRVGNAIAAPKEEALLRSMLPVVARESDDRNRKRKSNQTLNQFNVHNNLFVSIADNSPDQDDNGKDAGGDVKGKKGHGFAVTLFNLLSSAILATTKKANVNATPTTNVPHGNSGIVALGINIPTTSEPNMIFDPSRKKLERTLRLIFGRMAEWYDGGGEDVKWEKITSIEYCGIEQVYDISVANTHNFVAAGLLAHNTAIFNSTGLGLGTLSPSYKLDVSGAGHFTGLVDAANFVATSTSATSTFAGGLAVGTSKFLVDLSTGNVGIGTASPTQKLEINGNALLSTTNKLYLYDTAHSLGVQQLTSHFDGASSWRDTWTHAVSQGFAVSNGTDLNLEVDDTAGDVYIRGALHSAGTASSYFTGKVGIGTTSPSTLLSLAGTTGIFASTTATSTFQGGGINLLTAAGNTGCYSINGTCLPIFSDLTSNTYRDWKVQSGYLMPTTTLGILVSASSTIGGGTQTTGLTISGGATTTGNAYFAGNVGIGTVSPQQALHVVTPTSYQGILIEGGNSAPNVSFSRSGSTAEWKVGMSGNLGGAFSISKGTANDDKLFIDTSGNVGIGTTSPAALFSVGGNEYISGNSGIGIASPSYKLDVAGFINTDQYSGYKQAGNTILYASSTARSLIGGVSAGTAALSSPTPSDTVALGYTALGSGSFSGIQNTAVGSYALSVTTSGQLNTALGYTALQSNTTGSGNVAIGAGANAGNTTASNSIAIGRTASTGSGDENIGIGYLVMGNGSNSGVQNIAIGKNSLNAQTTGVQNIAIGGYATMMQNKTGGNNVAIGYQNLYFNGSATSTTAIGNYAAQGTGTYNNQGGTYVGYQSGFSAGTNSDYNSFFGYNSGYNVTTGSKNILLGYQAGDALTTGSNNIVLGYDIDAPSATASNQLVIGNILFGSNVNSTGTTVDTDALIGIGTSTPWGRLSVTNTGSGPSFVVEDDTSPDSTPFIIDSSGNVGIGTASPVASLQVYNVNSSGANNALTGAQILFGSSLTSGLGIRQRDTSVGISGEQYPVQIFAKGNLPMELYTADAQPLVFGVNATESMRISSTGKIGIGTTSPSTLFSLAGTTGIYASTTATSTFQGGGINLLTAAGNTGCSSINGTCLTTGALGLTGSQGQVTYFSGTNTAIGTSSLFIATSGNVGIGTTTPGEEFDIYKSQNGNTLLSVENTNSGSAAIAGLTLLSDGGRSYLYRTSNTYTAFSDATVLQDAGGGDIVLFGAAEIMRLKNSGNVGIGTTTPSGKLTVDAASAIVNSVETAGTLNLRSTTAQGIDIGPQLRFSGENGGGTTPYAFATIAGRKETATANVLSGYLQFNTTDSGSTINERMRITSTGNVGIGTTTPGEEFDIYKSQNGNTLLSVENTNSGSAAIAGLTLLSDGGRSYLYRTSNTYTAFSDATVLQDAGGGDIVLFGAAEIMRLKNSGNVGIGTTTPDALLTISKSTAGPVLLHVFQENTAQNATLQVQNTSIVNNASLQLKSYGDWSLSSFGSGSGCTGCFTIIDNAGGAGSRLTINSSGNVGIGTTSPASLLTVVGGGACFSGSGATVACGNTAGNLYYRTANTGTYDIAENYPTYDNSIATSTVVALDTAHPGAVVAATSSANVFGVVSSDPGMVLGGADPAAFVSGHKMLPIALSGRVPVRVNLEGGVIGIGDQLSLSSAPGIAKKAADGDAVIGTALENYVADIAGGRIEVFVTHGSLAGLSVADLTANLSQKPASESVAGHFLTNLFARITEWLADSGNGIAKIFTKELVAENIHAREITADEKLCVGQTCVTEAQLKALLAGAAAASGSGGGTPPQQSGNVGRPDADGNGSASSTMPADTAPAADVVPTPETSAPEATAQNPDSGAAEAAPLEETAPAPEIPVEPAPTEAPAEAVVGEGETL